jgi:uncharacterized membrane protein YcaP (DUF421 family)
MDLVLRATVVYFVIWILTRVVGRRELSTMEPLDLILLVILGDLTQQGVTQSDNSITGIVLAIGTMGLMTVLVSYVSFRVRRLRPLLDGEPIVLVQDGAPLLRNLRRERITTEELAASARLQAQIDSFDEVKWAILETNGQISWITK